MTGPFRARPLSIRGKVVLLAGLVTCASAAAFAVAYLIAARADTIARVRLAAGQSLARLQSGLDLPLWNLDSVTCRQIMRAELREASLKAIIVRDDASETLLAVRKDAGSGAPDAATDIYETAASSLDIAAPIRVSGAIYHAERRLGDVTILADPRDALAPLVANVLLATLLALLVGSAISAALFFAVDRIITSRLLALNAALRRFASREAGARSGEASADDIGQLAASFNAMADTISERSAELEDRTEEVRLLLDRVEREREEERTRVARELHDELGQSIAGLGMALYLLEHRVGKLVGPAAETASDMRSLLDELAEGMRRIVADLRPSVLDRIGLRPALARLAEESAERSGARVEFACDAPEGLEVPDEMKAALYRLAKEALTNALLHSGSPLVRISLEAVGGDGIVLEVRDEGAGFDPLAQQGGATRSFGIVGMRERCRALGGEFELKSAPGAGTSVRVSFAGMGRRGSAGTDS